MLGLWLKIAKGAGAQRFGFGGIRADIGAKSRFPF